MGDRSPRSKARAIAIACQARIYLFLRGMGLASSTHILSDGTIRVGVTSIFYYRLDIELGLQLLSTAISMLRRYFELALFCWAPSTRNPDQHRSCRREDLLVLRALSSGFWVLARLRCRMESQTSESFRLVTYVPLVVYGMLVQKTYSLGFL